MPGDYSIEELDALEDSELVKLDWKNMTRLNGRLLELHAEGALGNEYLAKLPRRPILCIDQIERIDDEGIEASFTFAASAEQWPFDADESLEMLFQDQLDQLVGFWGCRKADGIGRALSSGVSKLHQSLDFQPGKQVRYVLEKRKWMENKVSGGGGTAVFNGRILDADGAVMLETKNVIVGILRAEDIQALRQQHGGVQGVEADPVAEEASGLLIPVYDKNTVVVVRDGEVLESVEATQKIDPLLWPLRYHFRGDPVVPGNFGTHGMIALLKEVAQQEFKLVNKPVFTSLVTKKFSGMIFEDPKQIRFELKNIALDGKRVVAKEANLYLENNQGERMIEEPIYTFKNLTVEDI